ncbi:helix-hairpin-helix domain-containing protein [Peribacillus glennii]|uniref:Competence protein ComEA n=1 Tax=Peribacillus glennii TaxID=2303991 RepID=A0A372LHL0_9BACI|nr:helix-hairpin-helix domain-containing protein [Peribacillus glennii]RFU65778.1 competence protein ComEA [Peribacillus glennii]
MNTPRDKKLGVLFLILVISIAGYYFYQQSPQVTEKGVLSVEGEPGFTAGETGFEDGSKISGTPGEPKEPQIMKVDVKGEVKTPGVFVAKHGDRVIDVIAQAGNFTGKADKDQVNLAQLVEDQMVIYVPEIGEAPGSSAASMQAKISGSAANGGSAGVKVNINTAEAAELETLSGIGPSKSSAIIEYREKNGPFQKIEDLKNITGIGDKTFEKLMDSISVK